MTIAETIKQLRESVGMTRKEFSQHTGIPVRTLEDWEAARRTPPEYIPRLVHLRQRLILQMLLFHQMFFIMTWMRQDLDIL